MVLLIFLAILAYGLYQLFGAIALLWSVLPFVLALPIIAIKDLGTWLIHRKRDERNRRRRELWNRNLQLTTERLSAQLGDSGNYDENGTPYELP